MQSITAVYLRLDSIDKVKGFVNTIAQMDGDFDLVSSRYVVDAKSIMGIFSLDLSKTLRLDIYNAEAVDKLMPLLKDYIVEQ